MNESIHEQNKQTNETKNVPWINPSKGLVDQALQTWSDKKMRADNTSVVTVILYPPACSINKSGDNTEAELNMKEIKDVNDLNFTMVLEDKTSFQEISEKYLRPERFRNINNISNYENEFTYWTAPENEVLRTNNWFWRCDTDTESEDNEVGEQNVIAQVEPSLQSFNEISKPRNPYTNNLRTVDVNNTEKLESVDHNDLYVNSFAETYNSLLDAQISRTSKDQPVNETGQSTSATTPLSSSSGLQMQEILQEQQMYQQQCMSGEDGYMLTTLETRREQQRFGGMQTFKVFETVQPENGSYSPDNIEVNVPDESISYMVNTVEAKELKTCANLSPKREEPDDQEQELPVNQKVIETQIQPKEEKDKMDNELVSKQDDQKPQTGEPKENLTSTVFPAKDVFIKQEIFDEDYEKGEATRIYASQEERTEEEVAYEQEKRRQKRHQEREEQKQRQKRFQQKYKRYIPPPIPECISVPSLVEDEDGILEGFCEERKKQKEFRRECYVQITDVSYDDEPAHIKEEETENMENEKISTPTEFLEHIDKIEILADKPELVIETGASSSKPTTKGPTSSFAKMKNDMQSKAAKSPYYMPRRPQTGLHNNICFMPGMRGNNTRSSTQGSFPNILNENVAAAAAAAFAAVVAAAVSGPGMPPRRPPGGTASSNTSGNMFDTRQMRNGNLGANRNAASNMGNSTNRNNMSGNNCGRGNMTGTGPVPNIGGKGPIPNMSGRSTMPNMGGKGPIPNMSGRSTMPNMSGRGPIPNMNGKGPIPSMGGQGHTPNMGTKGTMPNMSGRGPIPNMNGRGPMPNMSGRAPMTNMSGRGPMPPMGGRGPMPNTSGKGPMPPMGGRGTMPTMSARGPMPHMGSRGPIPNMGGRGNMPHMGNMPIPDMGDFGSLANDLVTVLNSRCFRNYCYKVCNRKTNTKEMDTKVMTFDKTNVQHNDDALKKSSDMDSNKPEEVNPNDVIDPLGSQKQETVKSNATTSKVESKTERLADAQEKCKPQLNADRSLFEEQTRKANLTSTTEEPPSSTATKNVTSENVVQIITTTSTKTLESAAKITGKVLKSLEITGCVKKSPSTSLKRTISGSVINTENTTTPPAKKTEVIRIISERASNVTDTLQATNTTDAKGTQKPTIGHKTTSLMVQTNKTNEKVVPATSGRIMKVTTKPAQKANCRVIKATIVSVAPVKITDSKGAQTTITRTIKVKPSTSLTNKIDAKITQPMSGGSAIEATTLSALTNTVETRKTQTTAKTAILVAATTPVEKAKPITTATLSVPISSRTIKVVGELKQTSSTTEPISSSSVGVVKKLVTDTKVVPATIIGRNIKTVVPESATINPASTNTTIRAIKRGFVESSTKTNAIKTAVCSTSNITIESTETTGIIPTKRIKR